MDRFKIALCGKICSGKTTIARLLDKIDFSFDRFPITEPLKKIVVLSKFPRDMARNHIQRFLSRTFGDKAPQLYKEWERLSIEFEKEILTQNKPRVFIQCLGDAISRICGETDLVEIMNEKVERSPVGTNAICDDVRKIAEIEFLKNNNWFIVKVEAPAEVRAQRYKNKYGFELSTEQTHRTETEIDKYNEYDYIILNSEQEQDELFETTKNMYSLLYSVYEANRTIKGQLELFERGQIDEKE